MKLIRLLKRDLAAEVRGWIKDEIISTDQGMQILDIYGAELDAGKQRSLGYYLLLALSALLVGLGIIVLMSHNWQEIPRGLRLAGLFVGTLSLNLAGLHFWSRERFHAARAWLIAGSLSYGASIFLIGQIYHLRLDFDTGVLIWIAGILPLALYTRSITIALISTILSYVWIHWSFESGSIPYLYLGVVALLLYFVCKQRTSILLFLANIAGILFFFEYLLAYQPTGYRSLDFGVEHLFFTLAAQIVLFSLGGWLERWNASSRLVDYGVALRVWSARFGIFMLYFFTFEPFAKQYLKAFIDPAPILMLCIVLFVVIEAVLLIAFTCTEKSGELQFSSREGGIPLPDLLASTLFIVLSLTPMFLEEPLLPFLWLCNAAILCLGLCFILTGMKAARHSGLVTGTAMIMLLALFRYFDLIGSYIGTSVLFIGEGLLLLGIAHYSKQRISCSEEVGGRDE